MALDAIQQNSSSNNDLRRTSFLKSGAIGAVTGYALKYSLPIMLQENDDVFISESAQADADAKVVQEEMQLIKKDSAKIKGADEFIRLYQNKKIDFSTSSALGLSEDLQKLYSRVTSKIFDTKNLEIEKRVAWAKKIRPTFTFVAAGTALGLLSALVHNVYVENAKKGLDYDTLPL